MRVVALVLSCLLILVPLVDAFETILQPRRVTHRYRLARLYYRTTWRVLRMVALMLPAGKKRESILGVYGPISLLMLFGIWVASLVLGFGFLHYGLQSEVHGPGRGLAGYFYLSGVAFFTLGFAELVPGATLTRALGVIEAGLGFGFLAVIISYLPVLYGAYSRRETAISLLDARAGSPPSAAEFLLRLARFGRTDSVEKFLEEWELWSAELLESHLSFPVLSFYRSQHDNQSWLAALTMILDVCSLLIALGRMNTYRAQLTYAMARHAAVDLSLVVFAKPIQSTPDRLPVEACRRMTQAFKEAGLEVRDDEDVDAKLAELRNAYEPFAFALADRFLFKVPEIVPAEPSADNWQRSSWMKRTPGIGKLADGGPNDHF